MPKLFRASGSLAVGIVALGLATSAAATTLSITVTNTQSSGGLSITPLYLGFHNGDFDAFDVGSAASEGVREIAETGAPGPVAGERLAADPAAQGLFLPSPSGPPPIQPGETVSTQFTLNGTSEIFLTYLAMVLPSNDTFIGNDDPMAYQLLDAAGIFLGDQTIEVTGADIYDAGTEVNGLLGSAFVAGQDIALGDDENGVITAGQDLSEFAGVELATGDILGTAGQIDFLSDPANFSLLRIEITEVAPIPLPASAPMLLAALGFLGWRAKRKAQA